jgi:hypothetical protein
VVGTENRYVITAKELEIKENVMNVKVEVRF